MLSHLGVYYTWGNERLNKTHPIFYHQFLSEIDYFVWKRSDATSGLRWNPYFFSFIFLIIVIIIFQGRKGLQNWQCKGKKEVVQGFAGRRDQCRFVFTKLFIVLHFLAFPLETCLVHVSLYRSLIFCWVWRHPKTFSSVIKWVIQRPNESCDLYHRKKSQWLVQGVACLQIHSPLYSPLCFSYLRRFSYFIRFRSDTVVFLAFIKAKIVFVCRAIDLWIFQLCFVTCRELQPRTKLLRHDYVFSNFAPCYNLV